MGNPLTVRIRLLGGFAVDINGQSIPDAAWRLQKARSLIKLLALAPGHRLTRDEVFDRLWPDFTPETAANNLYSTLSAARSALAPHIPLRLRGGALALDPAGELAIDADEFLAAATAARGSSDLPTVEAALARYTGEFLPEDRYEDWAAPRREMLRGAYHELLFSLARLQTARGASEPAMVALRQLLAGDPTNESAHMDLMRLLASEGRTAEAMRQFQHLTDFLAQELDAEPSPPARRLHAEIATGRFTAVSRQSPVAAPSPSAQPAPAHNIPFALTSFLGREREVAELRELLTGARLLTLTGVGGIGKTRLALAMATAVLERFPGGVWLVELATLDDPTLLPQAIATALSVREEAGQSLVATLVNAIGAKSLLLVLDNCEHLLGGVAEIAQTLLSRCPNLRLLATSRETLGVHGELVWQVPPLAVPEAKVRERPEDLANCAAVALLLDRIRQRRLNFVLNDRNAPAIAEICRRLDGIPLALELAAARVGVLTVEQLAERLDDALRLLVGRERTAVTRQQTLQATIDWSYALLAESEQRLFRRLAPFAGGWTLSAIEAIGSELGGEPGGRWSTPSPPNVLDVLEVLTDKSLVLVEDRDDEARYRLLEPVRQYAAALLAISDEDDAIRERHATFFTTLAERAADRGLWQGRGLDHLAAEHANLLVALQWAAAHRQTDLGLRLCAALQVYWYQRASLTEGRDWCELFLAHEGPSSALRARILRVAGHLAFFQGDLAIAESQLRASIAMAEEIGDDECRSNALHLLGHVTLDRRDADAAEELFVEALALRRAIGNRERVATSLFGLGRTMHVRGDLAGARRHFTEALSIFEQIEDPSGTSGTRFALGEIAYAENDLSGAATLFEQSLAGWRGIGNELEAARVLGELGHIALERGDLDRAHTLLGQGLTSLQSLGIRRWIPRLLDGCAALAIVHGDPARALRLAAASTALLAALGSTPAARQTWLDRILAPAWATLAPEASHRAWSTGETLPLHAAIAEALVLSIGD
ncbi:MAG: BTAD domain-containing putative transcriptional regulator [Chloroflexia bacterium]